jgi:hypothetical protein
MLPQRDFLLLFCPFADTFNALFLNDRFSASAMFMIDLSHLNERGFWDVAAISNAPLVATHSNAHALSPHSRNLTDIQLAAIRETGGIVGVNFSTSSAQTVIGIQTRLLNW